MSTTQTTSDLPRADHPEQAQRVERAPSSLRTVFNLLARFRWSVKHYGPTLGNLALDAVEQPVREHEAAVTACSVSAQSIDHDLAGIRDQLQRDTSASDDTPFVLDRRETARLLRRLRALGHATTPHAAHLRSLL